MHIVYVNKAEKRFHSFGEHIHPFWELILVFEGSGTEKINGTDYPCGKGTIFCIPPETPHSSFSEEGMRDFSIGFGDFVPIRGNEPLVLTDDEAGNMYRLFEMELENVRRLPFNAKQLADALNNTIYQLLITFSREESDGNLVIAKLKEHMMRHLSDVSFDVGAAMDATGFSKGYLRRIFREATGQPPLAWLNHQRIEFAKQYFRQFPGMYTVREIGTMVGISDPYYFSKLFKKYTGVSPTGYVRQCELAGPGREEALTPETEVMWTKK